MIDALGIVHMGAGLFDPVIAGFLSADPIIPDPGLVHASNRNAYVYNNPLSYTDPSGHGPVSMVAGALLSMVPGVGPVLGITIMTGAAVVDAYLEGVRGFELFEKV